MNTNEQPTDVFTRNEMHELTVEEQDTVVGGSGGHIGSGPSPDSSGHINAPGQ